MIDNDNIMTSNASEVVKKRDEKDYHKCSVCVIVCI